MARIRTIKPEFWTSEQIMECDPLTRLLFIGLWNFCDDAGNHPLSSKTIKALVFPGDDITSSDVQRMLDELSSNNLIAFYESSGKRYLHVTGWAAHQKIDRPTYKFPPPENDPSGKGKAAPKKPRSPQPEGRSSGEPGGEPRSSFVEASTSARRGLTPGMEGKGSNNSLSPAHAGDSPPAPSGDAPFAMYLDWVPDQQRLKAYAYRTGIPITAFDQAAIGAFVVHHEAKRSAKSEAEWVSSLVNWIKGDQTRAAAAENRTNNVRKFPARQNAVDDDDFHATGWLGGD